MPHLQMRFEIRLGGPGSVNRCRATHPHLFHSGFPISNLTKDLATWAALKAWRAEMESIVRVEMQAKHSGANGFSCNQL